MAASTRAGGPLRLVDAEGPALPSDEELVHAIEHGDREAAGAIYDRLIDVVESTVFKVLGQRTPEHEDLVQQSFEQVIQTLARGRFAGACSLRSWARAITTHVALNALRRRRVDRGVFDRSSDGSEAAHDHAVPGSSPETLAGARALVDRVRSELADMSSERAEALVLHDVLGHGLAEIAVLTGVSVAAAQSRLSRGRRELRERLAKHDGGSDEH